LRSRKILAALGAIGLTTGIVLAASGAAYANVGVPPGTTPEVLDVCAEGDYPIKVRIDIDADIPQSLTSPVDTLDSSGPNQCQSLPVSQLRDQDFITVVVMADLQNNNHFVDLFKRVEPHNSSENIANGGKVEARGNGKVGGGEKPSATITFIGGQSPQSFEDLSE
jgi:hypothetical protein